MGLKDQTVGQLSLDTQIVMEHGGYIQIGIYSLHFRFELRDVRSPREGLWENRVVESHPQEDRWDRFVVKGVTSRGNLLIEDAETCPD